MELVHRVTGQTTIPHPSSSQKRKGTRRTGIGHRALRPNDYTDWPQFVIEAGKSEALPRLQADSSWWIENSKGQVRMMLLLNIDTKKRTIRILEYISVPLFPSTSHIDHSSVAVPSLTADILIDHSVTIVQTQGSLLTLKFDRTFGRSPNPPLEGNIVDSQNPRLLGNVHLVDRIIEVSVEDCSGTIQVFL